MKKTIFVIFAALILVVPAASFAQLWKKPIKKTVFLSIGLDGGAYQINDNEVKKKTGAPNFTSFGLEAGFNFGFYARLSGRFQFAYGSVNNQVYDQKSDSYGTETFNWKTNMYSLGVSILFRRHPEKTIPYAGAGITYHDVTKKFKPAHFEPDRYSNFSDTNLGIYFVAGIEKFVSHSVTIFGEINFVTGKLPADNIQFSAEQDIGGRLIIIGLRHILDLKK